MKLQTLTLHNFRNYAHLELECHPALNIFLGPNAQGKTNLLEAIYFLAMTRSHRTSHDRELIRWNESALKVSGTIEKNRSRLPLDVTLDTKGRTASVNHLKENRLADYIGQLNVILFAPEDLALVKGAPSTRRRFLDMEIGQIHPVYLYNSLRYNRALRERNSALKAAKPDPLLLDVLDEQLILHGAKIMTERTDFVQKLETRAQQIHQQLTHSTETLTIRYKRRVQEDFPNELQQSRTQDLARRLTSVGPHRDDLEFHINNISVADYGSQGQQRTVALSIKLAEIDLIHDETSEYPLLLLDDVMSELDNTRQLDLLTTSLGKTQTFITSTALNHLQNLPDTLSIFNVEAGQVKKAD